MTSSPKPTLTIHEQRGDWSRQLRPRLAPWGVALGETRSTRDLVEKLTGRAAPIVVISLSTQRMRMLADLIVARSHCPDALILVLDASPTLAEPDLIRQLGATHVISGVIITPAIVEILDRWFVLASLRLDHVGWCRNAAPKTPIGQAWHERWMGGWV